MYVYELGRYLRLGYILTYLNRFMCYSMYYITLFSNFFFCMYMPYIIGWVVSSRANCGQNEDHGFVSDHGYVHVVVF